MDFTKRLFSQPFAILGTTYDSKRDKDLRPFFHFRFESLASLMFASQLVQALIMITYIVMTQNLLWDHICHIQTWGFFMMLWPILALCNQRHRYCALLPVCLIIQFAFQVIHKSVNPRACEAEDIRCKVTYGLQRLSSLYIFTINATVSLLLCPNKFDSYFVAQVVMMFGFLIFGISNLQIEGASWIEILVYTAPCALVIPIFCLNNSLEKSQLSSIN